MELSRFLERIGYKGSREVTLQTLIEIQRAQGLNVPFENLDIHLGRKISLELEKIYDKVVVQRRGGLCHEQNGLLFHFLKEMGFDVIRVAGKVGEVGLESGHVVNICILDGEQYLVDTGFGGLPYVLNLSPSLYGKEQGAEIGPLLGMITPHPTDPDLLYVHSRTDARGEQRLLYVMKYKEQRERESFVDVFALQQTSADVHFVQGRIVFCDRGNTRRMFSGPPTRFSPFPALCPKPLKITETNLLTGEKTETIVESEREWFERLREWCGLSFSDELIASLSEPATTEATAH